MISYENLQVSDVPEVIYLEYSRMRQRIRNGTLDRAEADLWIRVRNEVHELEEEIC